VEESIILLNNLGDHYAEKNQPKLAALYFKKAAKLKPGQSWCGRRL
jgi:hypothetical protein